MYSALEQYSDKDYQEELLGNDLKINKCFSNIIYNQLEVDKYACTGQASTGCISDITNLYFPLMFRKKVWEIQLETGAVEGTGDYFSNGMKQSVKLFNEQYSKHFGYKLEYYRAKLTPSNISRILSNGSSIVTGYQGKLRSDAEDNGIIDSNDNKDGAGHCIRIVKYDSVRDEIKYCDNYNGHYKYNVITVPNFSKNKDFFKNGYYLKKVKI